MLIKTCYINILETSNVSLSAGTEDPDYPLYRLYDRDIGKIFSPTQAETIEIKIDQGSSPLAVDRLLIPAGHNLDGMTLDIKYSDDDINYSPAVSSWVQSGNGIIEKNWGSAIHTYWKFIITSPSGIPQISELFLTQTYEWERNPARPAGPFEDRFNVERDETAGGNVRYLVHGDPRKYRYYHVPRCTQAQRANIESLYRAWAGSKPFWLCDHEGNWIYGELLRPIELREEGAGKFSFIFEFLEVLP